MTNIWVLINELTADNIVGQSLLTRLLKLKHSSWSNILLLLHHFLQRKPRPDLVTTQWMIPLALVLLTWWLAMVSQSAWLTTSSTGTSAREKSVFTHSIVYSRSSCNKIEVWWWRVVVAVCHKFYMPIHLHHWAIWVIDVRGREITRGRGMDIWLCCVRALTSVSPASSPLSVACLTFFSLSFKSFRHLAFISSVRQSSNNLSCDSLPVSNGRTMCLTAPIHYAVGDVFL